MDNNIGNQIQYRQKANDVIYTPKDLAIEMINMCDIKETDKVLDCSLGGGVFFDNFPECNKDWCEIEKGRDFFKYTEGKNYDWVIGNPPYSLWGKWLEHTCKITDKFCYVFGVYNLTPLRLGKIMEKGFGITHFSICRVDWWFSLSFLVVFEKNKKSIIKNIKEPFYCEGCGKRCKRGRTYKGKKYSMNECSVAK
jgi:hypothetical protein